MENLKNLYQPKAGNTGSWHIPQRVFTVCCFLTLSLYLIYGTHSQMLCNTIATIPAALFTYSILVKSPPEPGTQKSILIYWSVHSVLVCCDSALCHVFGYYLAKLVLLSALLMYSVRKSASFIKLRDRISAEKHGNPLDTDSSLKSSLITMRSTITSFPLFESDLTMSTALSESSLEAPMKTITKSGAQSSTKTIYDLLKENQNKNKYMKNAKDSLVSSAATSDVSTCGEHSRFEPSSFFHHGGDEFRAPNKYFKDVPEYDTENGDYLITSPDEKVIFKFPLKGSVTVSLTNANPKPMMWALKTNALQRLAAQPTCGVLPSCATVHLRIGLLEVPPTKSLGLDRIAVDYCITEEGIAVFDRSFMKRNGHVRKNLLVDYII